MRGFCVIYRYYGEQHFQFYLKKYTFLYSN